MTPLQKKRLSYIPKKPTILADLNAITFAEKGATEAIGDKGEIEKRFPQTYGRPLIKMTHGKGGASKPLKVGVVLSGGQAAGGHNVITGLFDALKKIHPESHLFGFLGGPSGIVDGKYRDLSEDELANYRNQGGFDLIGSGRTKIESEEQFAKSLEVAKALELNGLVVIGGDDSNTNAALLAEYFIDKGCKTRVIGVPKTIDGDLQNEHVAISFGFDTACKTYSEMIGNIARDALSAKKYTHFIKLMGRSASHIALECALQTQPNYVLIGEEVEAKNQTLQAIAQDLIDVIERRGKEGKNYGVILIPEGLIEFIPEMKTLIQELNILLAQEGGSIEGLSAPSKKTFDYLPKEIQDQLLLDRDPHGNVQVSHIQTEMLLSHVVKAELKKRNFQGKFNAIHHFFGYEGRSCFPSNFDATYCYSLGIVSALLIREGFTGYMSCVTNLREPVEAWGVIGIPITSLMNMEVRKGKEKPVIQKALVDLKGQAFKRFARDRDKWKLQDHYQFPGPIQFEGDPSYTDQIPKILS
ncbi:MAG: diphosphate--fructose-6-phosphate 1-phosphotransferase [Simkania sp.]|nr:diphosphate--fructose-6-phosphate 1-phosphotransferase [Simkania sp.]